MSFDYTQNVIYMKEITLNDVRQALRDTQYPSVMTKVDNMSDDELKKACFRTDFGMDSLDTIELSMNLERRLSVSVPDRAVSEYITKGGTVQAMMDVFNNVISAANSVRA